MVSEVDNGAVGAKKIATNEPSRGGHIGDVIIELERRAKLLRMLLVEDLDKAIKPREGTSLRPAFNGEPLARTQPLFWEHEGNRAVRDGDWKLVAKEGEPWELYNIAIDRTESNDLAASEPSRVRDLAAKWDGYAARANVLPLGTWRQESPDQGSFSDKKRFELKAGEHLERAKAPAIQGRPFTIEARFEANDAHLDGVIVAQGGTANGFSLFLKAGRPRFVIRSADVLYGVIGPKLTTGEHVVTAKLDRSGTLTLGVDGKPVAEPFPGKLVARMPADGLDVGEDRNGAVGVYSAPYPYSGRIKGVVIEIDDR